MENELGVDLTFDDEVLEAAFRRSHALDRRGIDCSFHYARSLTWMAVAVRSWLTGSAVSLAWPLFGAVTTLVPAFAWRLGVPYSRWRTALIFGDNILQVVLGVLTFDIIYHERTETWQTTPTPRALAVLLTGSGFAWLGMSGLLGSLVFRHALLQQAVLALAMLLGSPSMCHDSRSLQHGHMLLRGALLRAARRPLALLGPHWAPNTPGTAEAMARLGYQACVWGQAGILILLGYMLPAFILFRSEVHSRLHFLQDGASCRLAAPGLGDFCFYAGPMAVGLAAVFASGLLW